MVSGIKIRDIDRDMLMAFVLSYEYSMSFPNVYKLFKISKKYFWTFMEVCAPMLKMGIRKASMIKKSVDKIFPYLSNEGEKEELTTREENILELFSWYIEDSFSDGEGCLSLEQLKQIPFVKGYEENDTYIGTGYDRIKSNIDRIKYVDIAGTKFFKTSKFIYYMEKYCGDLDIYQISNLSVRDMLYKIEDGERRLEEIEREECEKEYSR